MEVALGDLVKRAQQHDASAFADLIRRCERMALSVAFSACGDGNLAGDIVQEAFLRAWQRLAGLENPSSFEAWLCGIIRNLAIDMLRRIRPAAPTAILDERPSRADEVGAEMDRREQDQQIAQALDALDDVSRAAVVMRYYDDMPSRRIGQLLGLSAAAVDMRLSRARQELRQRLSGLATASTAGGR